MNATDAWAGHHTLASKFRNEGQTCVCANRIYVQESVAEAFAEKLAEKAGGLKLGRGTEAGVTMGPLIDGRAVAKMEEHVADALAKGGRVLAGSKRYDRFRRKSERGQARSRYFEPRSCGEQVKLLCERGLRIPGVDRLLLAHHVDHLDPAQDHSSAVHRLEPEHWPHSPLDGSMILFDAIVQVGTSPDPDRLQLAP